MRVVGSLGWQYTSRTVEDGVDLEQWCLPLREEGWRTWEPGHGTYTEIHGRRYLVVNLRRPCFRPFGVHDHAQVCVPHLPEGEAGPSVGLCRPLFVRWAALEVR